MPARTDNSIVIDAPLDLVWDVTNDVASWPDLFTEYATAEILDRTDRTVRFRLTMHPDENGKVWSWVSERTLDEATHEVVARRVEPGPFERTADRDTHTVESHRVETGPFEYMKIHWSYQPVEGGTRMHWVQDFQMKPGAPVNDAQMAERINKNSPIQMATIKEKIERRYVEESRTATS